MSDLSEILALKTCHPYSRDSMYLVQDSRLYGQELNTD